MALNELINSRQQLERCKASLGNAYPFLELLTFDTEKWEDDFIGDLMYGGAVPGVYTNYTNASGTFTLLNDSTRGSVARLSTIGATANDYIQTYLKGLYAQGQKNAFLAARIYLANVSSIKIEMGFADAEVAGVVNVLATPTFNATDGVVWAFDTNDTGNAVGFQLVGVDTAVGATKIEPSEITVTAATWYTLGIQLKDGNAKGFIWDENGLLVTDTDWMTSAVTSTVSLLPHMFLQTRTGTAKTCDIDLLKIWQRRTVS